VPIGDWVLRRALHDVGELRSRGEFKVSINLSPEQLLDTSLVTTVADVLAANAWPAHRLVLEITETAVVTNLSRSTAHLAALRGLGVKIAIDDFGTGYSSLSYLRDLPIDIVKIDRSFVASFVEDPRSATLMRGIIGMATGLGLSLIAEGVESQAQADALRALDCRVGQGHFFARAMTIGELVAIVMSANAGDDPASASDATGHSSSGTAHGDVPTWAGHDSPIAPPPRAA
jgi:EAL domain-containing protein (putative c-di-GMP-specific phosphodiesterase class I)